MSSDARLRARWAPVDGIIAAYTIWMGMLIALCSARVPQWPQLLATHTAIVVALLIIPPRGAAWEARRPRGWRRAPHELTRFVRHAYPLPLALFFFEEGRVTVNMIFPDAPYWFEPRLYAADAALFGRSPALLLDPWVTPWLTELMSFFYWSYYIIMIAGVAAAYLGRRGRDSAPAPGFDDTITGLAAAFILAFLFYPWLAARGPWENPALMAGLRAPHGGPFTWMMDRIIEHGAVSGNCFPSGHVAGAWAIVLALAGTRQHRTAAYLAGVLSAGLTVACVYTRYHHAVDTPAGLACAVAGALLAGWLGRWHRAAPAAP